MTDTSTQLQAQPASSPPEADSLAGSITTGILDAVVKLSKEDLGGAEHIRIVVSANAFTIMVDDDIMVASISGLTPHVTFLDPFALSPDYDFDEDGCITATILSS